MWYILAVAGGVILGALIQGIVIWLKSGRGYFSILPVEDEGEETGFYRVGVSLRTDEKLSKKSLVILVRDKTQK